MLHTYLGCDLFERVHMYTCTHWNSADVPGFYFSDGALCFFLIFFVILLACVHVRMCACVPPKKYQKKHIVTKDVVGLLIGEIVRTHIIAKDVVGLLAGDSKNDSLTKMKTYQ